MKFILKLFKNWKRRFSIKKKKIVFKPPFSYDYTFKVILFGETGAGKTGLAQRYCYDIFDPSDKLTIGVDFYVKSIEMHGKRVKLQIWDISCEDQFRFLFPSYCLGANAAILIYDITKAKTLNPMSEWIQIIREKAGDIPIILIGTKLDLEEFRDLNRETVLQIAEKYNLSSYNEISTKTGENVDNTFGILTELLIEQTSNY
ncbi:MAG: Rab family GTPase [Promethearchaeota archaeon]